MNLDPSLRSGRKGNWNGDYEASAFAVGTSRGNFLADGERDGAFL